MMIYEKMSAQMEEVRKMLKSVPLDSLAQLMKTKELIQEYCEAFKEEVNNNKIIEKEASDWEGDFLFIIGKDKYLDEDIIAYCNLWHGKCREMIPLASREKKTAFVFEGPFENWYKLWIGEIGGAIMGLMRKKFKLEGSLTKIAKYRKSTTELLNCSLICFAKIGERFGFRGG